MIITTFTLAIAVCLGFMLGLGAALALFSVARHSLAQHLRQIPAANPPASTEVVSRIPTPDNPPVACNCGGRILWDGPDSIVTDNFNGFESAGEVDHSRDYCWPAADAANPYRVNGKRRTCV